MVTGLRSATVLPPLAARLVILAATFLTATVNAASVGEAEVKQCVQQILQRIGGGCPTYFSVESVNKVDGREASGDAFVIADIIFRVRQQVAAQSEAAIKCTGTAWKGDKRNPYAANTGAWFLQQSQMDVDGGYLPAGRGLRVRKKFKFERWESGWRCAENGMSPVESGWFVNAPSPPPTPAQSRNYQSPSKPQAAPLSKVDNTFWVYDGDEKLRLVDFDVRAPLAAIDHLVGAVASLFGATSAPAPAYAEIPDVGPNAQVRLGNRSPSFGEISVPIGADIEKLVSLVRLDIDPTTKTFRVKLEKVGSEYRIANDVLIPAIFEPRGDVDYYGQAGKNFRMTPANDLADGEYAIVINMKKAFVFAIAQ